MPHSNRPSRAATLFGALLAALLALGCGKSDFYRWAGSDAGGDTDTTPGSEWYSLYEAVDFLLVVDNSDSMDEEQKIFGTSQFTLINGLVNPLPNSGLIGGLDDVRVAVVSTDMGLSWGGHPYEEGDGWPASVELPCTANGDNGVFQTYDAGKQIKVQDGVIACHESGAQCPSGWTCTGAGTDGVGLCAAPAGDTTVDCPWLDDDWAQTPSPTEVPNPYVATQVACLTNLGTEGCGFEQHLESADKALNRFDQLGFIRDEALLAVIVVSDEDDCSLESNSLFYEPEIQENSMSEVNIACGEHPEHLYPIDDYRQAFLDVKDGDLSKLLFAAVVGVPIADACQGWGDEIAGCLDHPDMQLEPETVHVPDVGNVVFYAPACTRTAGEVEVTRAAPARRLVQLALDLGSRGFVSSICNDDWSQAMNELAAVIPLKPD